jgi:hypothetical protein
MKKVFSGLFLIFSYPFRLLKKWKFDNFIGGLLFGALFSLIVNIYTVHIQETIQRQRVLEALENEIMLNTLTADEVFRYNMSQIDSSPTFNPFYVVRRYSRDLWQQSTEPLQYTSQLDQETQIALTTYYTLTVPINNGQIDNIINLTNQKLLDCYNLENPELVDYSDYCTNWSIHRYIMETYPAEDMSEAGYDLLAKFHPTADRLDNWFLKLIMGDKSTRILSGK